MSEHVNDTADAGVITDIGNDVFQIDTRMAGYSGITAGYLIRSERPCLVETGTAPSAPVVRGALTALGIGPADLATIVVTHIHLDHAGGAGDLAAAFPGAEVVVHELGARHLADPSRLMASARMVYGGELDALFGSMAPTPAGRIRAVGRVGAVDLGGGQRRPVRGRRRGDLRARDRRPAASDAAAGLRPGRGARVLAHVRWSRADPAAVQPLRAGRRRGRGPGPGG